MTLKEAFAIAEVLRFAKRTSLEKLSGFGRLKKMKKGEHLFMDKQVVDAMYIVISGLVTLYKTNSMGDNKVVFVYGKGKAINEVILNELPASISCEILSDAVILVFPVDQLIEVLEQDFGLTKAIMDSMSIKIRRLYRQLKNTSNMTRMDKKIAAKLWKLSMDYGIPCEQGTEIELDITITYIADMIGSKRETVSRQLKLLTDKDLVIFKNSRFIIPDCEKLREYFKKA